MITINKTRHQKPQFRYTSKSANGEKIGQGEAHPTKQKCYEEIRANWIVYNCRPAFKKWTDSDRTDWEGFKKENIIDKSLGK